MSAPGHAQFGIGAIFIVHEVNCASIHDELETLTAVRGRHGLQAAFAAELWPSATRVHENTSNKKIIKLTFQMGGWEVPVGIRQRKRL